MAFMDRGLEEELMVSGQELLKSPVSVEELLPLLDKLENCLSRVEQSPSKSIQNALHPAMEALVANDLLRHLNWDVKVSVASCISEITRINAPDPPYNDERMNEIFQLIVATFEKLSQVSSPRYSKVNSILDIVAKVKLSLVMLDLECEELIIEMFQHFLKSIRTNHPHAVFLNMESIMTLVLEESDDISWNKKFLCSLLDSVERENHIFSPMYWKLGERVIKSCAAKLTPYFMETVQTMGIVLNDYAPIVASMCQNVTDMLEQNYVNISGKHLANENKLLEKIEAVGQSHVAGGFTLDVVCLGEFKDIPERSPNLVVSKNATQIGNGGCLVDPTSSKEQLPNAMDKFELASESVEFSYNSSVILPMDVRSRNQEFNEGIYAVIRVQPKHGINSFSMQGLVPVLPPLLLPSMDQSADVLEYQICLSRRDSYWRYLVCWVDPPDSNNACIIEYKFHRINPDSLEQYHLFNSSESSSSQSRRMMGIAECSGPSKGLGIDPNAGPLDRPSRIMIYLF